jgi:hypothetical protein
MKRVAIVGAEFAPSSLPNAQRVRFLASHLEEFGWEPLVVTVHPRHYESKMDPDNEKLLPASLKVLRTSAFSVKWTRKVGFGDVGMRSLYFHWRALSKLCRRKQVDVIFISLLPGISAVLGRLIYAQYGVSYVIDYQDPWLTDYYWTVPKDKRPPKWPVVYAMTKVLEPFALKRVNHITGVSLGTTEGVTERYSWLKEIGTTEIPLGGEPQDFAYLREHPRLNAIFDPNDGFVHLCSVGRGGPDTLPVLEGIFQAIQRGLKTYPHIFSRLRLHFVGTTYAPDSTGQHQVLPLVQKMGLEDFIDEHPSRVAYLDSLQILLDSHALLVTGSILPHYTASKIFPYIISHRPLLAVFHERSSVVEIVRETNSGHVVTFNEQNPPASQSEKILDCLLHILALPPNYLPPTQWEAFEPYTARSMAKRLAGVFDQVLACNKDLI